MFVDSHCHLDLLDLDQCGGTLDAVFAKAKSLDVGYFLCVCVDDRQFDAMVKQVGEHPNVWFSVGLHPADKVEYVPTVERLCELAQHPKVIAIGETGLDYFHCKGDVIWQQERFRTHIRAAKQLNKSLIIHSRDAPEDTIAIMVEEGAEQIGGVMHCFTEGLSMAKAAMALNFYISFSGIVTFKNAKALQHVAKEVPLNKILVETDSPYLAPVPFRGKPNQPGYTRYVAEKIAELKGETLQMVAKTTTDNFFRLFKL